MKITGFKANSFVDYPNNIAAVVFLGRCNFDCWFCHNRWMLNMGKLYEEDIILKKIKENSFLLDAVVITGGEPTMEDTKELISFIKKIKDMNLKVKLDTNGTNPEKLEQLLPYVDYVAMDIKSPLSKYREITCIDDDELLALKKCINILMNSGKEYEFRTTFIPTLETEDILEIANTIKGCKRYYLQQYIPVEGKEDIEPHPPKYIKKTCAMVEKILPCEIRGL
ncbi:MAG: anaerobic ribonucleoside-triphosphate reductase activating protein [Bacillota bacterium]